MDEAGAKAGGGSASGCSINRPRVQNGGFPLSGVLFLVSVTHDFVGTVTVERDARFCTEEEKSFSRCGHFPSGRSRAVPGPLAQTPEGTARGRDKRDNQYGSRLVSSVFTTQYGSSLSMPLVPRCPLRNLYL